MKRNDGLGRVDTDRDEDSFPYCSQKEAYIWVVSLEVCLLELELAC